MIPSLYETPLSRLAVDIHGSFLQAALKMTGYWKCGNGTERSVCKKNTNLTLLDASSLPTEAYVWLTVVTFQVTLYV
jgi:hypothetical protein